MIENEIVKYKNELNSLSLTTFNAIDLDALMLLCARVKEHGGDVVEFEFRELKKKLRLEYETDNDLIKILKGMNAKLNKVSGHYENSKEIVDFVLFPTFRTLKDERKLQVRVNVDFQYLLNQIESNFTRFELDEFVRLDSKYSKNLYRLLKQYRRTGTYIVEACKFRELMDCPKSYPNKIFMRDCVNVAIQELSRGYFKDLKVTPIRAKRRGAPIEAYEFTFRKSKDVPGQYNVTDYDESGKLAETERNKVKQNKFNNFQQRKYDFAELERKLLTTPAKGE